MEEDKKKIDESWKDAIDKEKVEIPQENNTPIPEASFSFFITTLGMQIAIALGEIPSPFTNKTEENLNQAKFIIDTLDMLKEKTKNNLTKEEERLLDNLLYEFKIKFVEKKKGELK